jgi:hypothetical protein
LERGVIIRVKRVIGALLRGTIVGGLLGCMSIASVAADAKGYTCTFPTGAALIYGNGIFKAEPASPLNLEISDIDVRAQSALQVGASGTVPLRIVRAVNALHFIEVVGEGFLNLTTIYDRDDKTGKNPAVQSRHFGILGEPVVSRYQGFCESR